jgi:hypothetical protein
MTSSTVHVTVARSGAVAQPDGWPAVSASTSSGIPTVTLVGGWEAEGPLSVTVTVTVPPAPGTTDVAVSALMSTSALAGATPPGTPLADDMLLDRSGSRFAAATEMVLVTPLPSQPVLFVA